MDRLSLDRFDLDRFNLDGLKLNRPDVERTIDGRIAHLRFYRPRQGSALRPQNCRELIDMLGT